MRLGVRGPQSGGAAFEWPPSCPGGRTWRREAEASWENRQGIEEGVQETERIWEEEREQRSSHAGQQGREGATP